MSKMLLLGDECPATTAVEAALGDAGYGVVTVADHGRGARGVPARELRPVLHRRRRGRRHRPSAAEAEDRRVRTVIMAQSEGVLDALRAKGLICFQCPASLDDLKSAVHARL